jgi:hypothetical protein
VEEEEQPDPDLGDGHQPDEQLSEPYERGTGQTLGGLVSGLFFFTDECGEEGCG